MFKKVASAMAVAGVAVMIGATSAKALDGNDLLRWCNAGERQDGSFSAGICYGYIIGVAHTTPGEQFCIPQNAINEQIKDTSLSWINKKPRTWALCCVVVD